MPSWKKIITSGSNAAFSSLTVSNIITGSISGSLTGSLCGTASWAQNTVQSTSASYADTASYVSLPYAVYTAIFTSEASTTPVYTVLQNTLGDNLIWTNSGPNANIKLTADNNPQLFTGKQIYWNAHVMKGNGNPGVAVVNTNNTDALQIYPYDLSGNLVFDLGDSGSGLYCTLDIKVFS